MNARHPSPIPAVIVGVAGYTGQELVRLIAGHPSLALAGAFGTERTAGGTVGDLCPSLRGLCDLPVRSASPEAMMELLGSAGSRVAFLATPHEASAVLAPALAQAGVLVADLSAAFRFPDAATYPAFYGFEHPSPGWLDRAVYGLPELTRARLRGLRGQGIIACAGCYVTSSLVPLRPLVAAGALRAGTRPIIDATSGVSGAGRKAQAHTSFSEVSQSPYGVLRHRHRPEIETHAGLPIGGAVFQPHLGPYSRGILATLHVELAPGWTEPRLRALFDAAYSDEPFVRLLPSGTWPSVGAVERTNFVDLALAAEEHAGGVHAVIFSALDNLMKGASSQAVQCVNAALSHLPGWSETLGLGHPRAHEPAADKEQIR
jgi:N-acetyl-gamma-glutamyl-phosphate reductase